MGRPRYPVGQIPRTVWLALGYVVLGDIAARVDLAEQAAQALLQGQPELQAFRSLGLPKRNVRRVAGALREMAVGRDAEDGKAYS